MKTELCTGSCCRFTLIFLILNTDEIIVFFRIIYRNMRVWLLYRFFQEASSSRSQSSEPKSEHQPIEVAVVSRDVSESVAKDKEDRPQTPDHDAYPSLPGTPEPTIPEMTVQHTKRKSLPPELPSKRTREEVNCLYLT